jgi:WD40 repeat protein
VSVWDTASVKQVGSLGSWEGVDSAELSSDGRLAVTAIRSGQARVYDLSRDEELAVIEHAGPVLHATFGPDSKLVATASTDRTVKVSHARAGTPALATTLYHEDTVSHVSFSGDGLHLATITANGIARVWRLNTAPATFRHPRGVRSVAFLPDGARLLTATDAEVQVWDRANGKPLRLPVSTQVYQALASPDGKHVLTATESGMAQLWDGADGREALALRHPRRVSRAAFDPRGRWVATASGARTLIWELATGQKLAELGVDSSRHLEFTPEGKRPLTIEFGGVGRLWDVADWREIQALRQTDVNAAAFAPDGERLAWVQESSSVSILELASGHRLPVQLPRDYRILHLAFRPDGSALAVASEGGFARLFDPNTGMPLTPPLAHQGTVRYVAFSSDGRRLATASDDHTARIWDAATGQALTPPLRHGDAVREVLFSRDGLRVATASSDGAARIWDVPPKLEAGDFMLLAQALAARKLDDTGALVYLSSGEFQNVWARLRGNR